MKNKLEDFVNRNRADFDTEMPQRDIWKEIERTPVTTKPKLIRLFSKWKVAAAVLVMLNAGILFFLFQHKADNDPALQLKTPAGEKEQIQAPSYEKEIDQIGKAVEVKQAKLKEIEKANPVLYKTFLVALDQLNSSYKQLEKDLDNTPNKEQLLEAMIQNLSLQQELLNQQLSIYQTLKQKKNEKNSKNM